MSNQSMFFKWIVTMCMLFLFWELMFYMFPFLGGLSLLTSSCLGVMAYVLPLEFFGYDIFEWRVVNCNCLWNRFMDWFSY